MDDRNTERPQYIPKLLFLRMTRRAGLKNFSFVVLAFHFAFLILGFIFIDGIWNTRKYISNGNDYWDYFKIQSLSDKEVQYYCTFSGILCLLSSAFNIMNMIVIIVHTFNGGLRARLKFCQWIHFLMQLIIFIYSFIPLIRLQGIISLFPALFAVSVVNEIFAIVLFMLIRRVVRKELDFMLSIELMDVHEKEFREEYIKRNTFNIIEPNNANDEDANKIFVNNLK
jgi:hypothetical protein